MNKSLFAEPDTSALLSSAKPIQIWFHSYHVKLAGSIQPREGLLVKVRSADGTIGFSDLMAWPELGDQTLSHERLQLQRLVQSPSLPDDKAIKLLSPLCLQVLRNSFLDAHARAHRQTLWSGAGPIPKSHVLIGNGRDLWNFFRNPPSVDFEIPSSTILKVKWSEELNADLLESIPHRVRIDFNERANRSVLKSLFVSKSILDKVDFIEDPFPAGAVEDWEWCSREFPGLRVFGDFALEKNPDLEVHCQGLVLKPASRNVDHWRHSTLPMCVTHSLGHTFGQMISACYAAHLPQVSVSCGLFPSPRVEKSSLAPWDGKSIPAGEGFGFATQELMALSWESA